MIHQVLKFNIENFGTGIPRILHAYVNSVRQPEFLPSESFFILKMPNMNFDPINDPINDPIKLTVREQQLLQLLRESPELTRRELAGKLGCSDSTVKRELQILSEQGILRRIGSRKTGVWVINR